MKFTEISTFLEFFIDVVDDKFLLISLILFSYTITISANYNNEILLMGNDINR